MKNDKIDSLLLHSVRTLSSGGKVDCIARARDYKRLQNILHNKNIEIVRSYNFIGSFWIKVTRSELSSLSSSASVEYIYSLSKACTLMHVAKNVLNVQETKLTGDGINIAFIDTGIYSHLDFLLGKKRVKYFKDFIHDRKNPYDDNGHGTFVAGVCAGGGNMSGGRQAGIAPKSSIISLKALNSGGEASADKILNAMEWVYDNHKQQDIKVVCMSFGSEPLGFNDPIMSGAEALWGEGVVVIAAAGNSGPEYQTIKSPGVSSKIITVGGFDDNRFDDDSFKEDFFEVANFSSRGPAFARYKPDLVAPSVDIISCGIKKPYIPLSGTSVATPMIAGMAALMLEKDKSLSPDDIKRRLIKSCHPITFNRNLEGYGWPIWNE